MSTRPLNIKFFSDLNFPSLFFDWSIQNLWEILSQKFWIDQSKKREGKFKIKKRLNFWRPVGQTEKGWSTKLFEFVIHMVRASFGLRDREIWDGVKGPTHYLVAIRYIAIFLENCSPSILEISLKMYIFPSFRRHLWYVVAYS